MQRRMLWVALIAAALVVVAFGYGCGEMSAGTCADNGTCVGVGMPGSDATAGDVEQPPDAMGMANEGSTVRPDAGDAGGQGDAGEAGNVGCDPSQDPKDTPCLVDGVYGVFVSGTTGQDTAIGTKMAPLKTITEGIAKAAQLGKSRVYVCNGSYAEQVSLDAQHDGIGLYGGFDCGRGWAWDGDAGATQVVGPSALYALRVDATTKGIAIEDMSFTVPDATGHDSTGAGNSSIAAFVSNETAGVNFQRVGLRAGAGAGGSGGGVPPTNLFSANANDLLGNSADGGAGGAAKDCHCKIVGDTIGGAGGAAGDPGGDGGAGSASPLPGQLVRNGAGGAGYNDTSQACGPGRPGADGPAQPDGGVAADIGSLTASGWEPGAGADGLTAYPAQGGGGGGGGQGGGGGGGCGGCGGAGGLAGHGGGASVALLLFNATVSVAESRLVSAAGGAGGPGSSGEGGGGGGNGGTGNPCGGGTGGSGAGGQGGGGGAGGLSLGILSNATSHSMVDAPTSFMLGTPGSGGGPGGGGDGGSVSTDHAPAGPAGTKGADGIAQQMLSR